MVRSQAAEALILLHQLDGEMQRRRHRFARYADDLVILVESQRAGERAIDANPRSITRYLETTLKIKVNPAASTRKSARWHR